MKTRMIRLLILLPLLVGAVSGRCAERFAGRFTGEGMAIDAQGNEGNYTGIITLGENAFKFTAIDKPDGLVGAFTTPDGQFDFRATLKSHTLTLSTGGARYKLTRFNPLAKAKSGESTGGKVTGFVRQHGGAFLGQFMKSVADNKGQVSESATAAGFSVLSSIGQQLGGSPPQTPTAPSQPGAPSPQISGAPSQAGATPAITANALAGNQTHANGLLGTWVRTEQNVVNGAPSSRPTFAVFRPDGTMLITVNPSTAGNFYKHQSPSSPQSAGAPQSVDADVHAHWTSNNSILTMIYDGGATAQYTYEIGSNAAGLTVLRIRGAGGDGSPVQEWTKSN